MTQPVAGQPALLGFTGRTLTGVLVFTCSHGKIQAVHVIGDPRQLGFRQRAAGLGTAPGQLGWAPSLSAGCPVLTGAARRVVTERERPRSRPVRGKAPAMLNLMRRSEGAHR